MRVVQSDDRQVMVPLPDQGAWVVIERSILAGPPELLYLMDRLRFDYTILDVDRDATDYGGDVKTRRIVYEPAFLDEVHVYYKMRF